ISIEGDPPSLAEPHGWGISVSVTGEFQRAPSGRLFTVTGREIEAPGVDAFAVARGRTKKNKKKKTPATISAPAATPARQLAHFENGAA
ncbi:hypothetical protein ACWDV6_43710, partial [Rhodococcus koreensis]